MKNLIVSLTDRPGKLADVAEAFGKAGINIEGICQIPQERKGIVHFLVEDVPKATRVLEEIGAQVEEVQDVLLVECKNQPGEVGRITRKIADVGVNINLAYAATRNRLVLGVDDLDKARTAIKYDPLYFKEFIKSGL